MALSFSHAVLAWARTKPADLAYNYDDPANCGICQFLRDTGRARDPWVVMNFWREGEHGPVPYEFDERVDDAAWPRPHTFGAFADRLEAVL